MFSIIRENESRKQRGIQFSRDCLVINTPLCFANKLCIIQAHERSKQIIYIQNYDYD